VRTNSPLTKPGTARVKRGTVTSNGVPAVAGPAQTFPIRSPVDTSTAPRHLLTTRIQQPHQQPQLVPALRPRERAELGRPEQQQRQPLGEQRERRPMRVTPPSLSLSVPVDRGTNRPIGDARTTTRIRTTNRHNLSAHACDASCSGTTSRRRPAQQQHHNHNHNQQNHAARTTRPSSTPRRPRGQLERRQRDRGRRVVVWRRWIVGLGRWHRLGRRRPQHHHTPPG
jgi:hypothetical protein